MLSELLDRRVEELRTRIESQDIDPVDLLVHLYFIDENLLAPLDTTSRRIIRRLGMEIEWDNTERLKDRDFFILTLGDGEEVRIEGRDYREGLGQEYERRDPGTTKIQERPSTTKYGHWDER